MNFQRRRCPVVHVLLFGGHSLFILIHSLLCVVKLLLGGVFVFRLYCGSDFGRCGGKRFLVNR